jgi:hypothetical protein
MGANFVLQMYNVFGVGEYALWIDKMYEKYPNWNQPTFAIPLEWPQGFDIGFLTSEHRKELVKELNTIEQQVHHTNTIKFIRQCVNWILTREIPKSLVPQQSFKQLTLAMDQQRSTSLVELDERLKEYIK